MEGTSKQYRGRGNYGRGGQYPYGGRNTNRRGSNQYYQQNRIPCLFSFHLLSNIKSFSFIDGGQYDNSYNGGEQRSYYDNTRGRGGYRGKKIEEGMD